MQAAGSAPPVPHLCRWLCVLGRVAAASLRIQLSCFQEKRDQGDKEPVKWHHRSTATVARLHEVLQDEQPSSQQIEYKKNKYGNL